MSSNSKGSLRFQYITIPHKNNLLSKTKSVCAGAYTHTPKEKTVMCVHPSTHTNELPHREIQVSNQQQCGDSRPEDTIHMLKTSKLQ